MEVVFIQHLLLPNANKALTLAKKDLLWLSWWHVVTFVLFFWNWSGPRFANHSIFIPEFIAHHKRPNLLLTTIVGLSTFIAQRACTSWQVGLAMKMAFNILNGSSVLQKLGWDKLLQTLWLWNRECDGCFMGGPGHQFTCMGATCHHNMNPYQFILLLSVGHEVVTPRDPTPFLVGGVNGYPGVDGMPKGLWLGGGTLSTTHT